jgi:hypothetical protein
MVSSGMLRRVNLVGADVSEDFNASFIRVTRIGELFLRNVRRLLVTANVPRLQTCHPDGGIYKSHTV